MKSQDPPPYGSPAPPTLAEEVAMKTLLKRHPGPIAICTGDRIMRCPVSLAALNGTAELYSGARTVRAIEARLTRERCSGVRWARAVVQCAPTLAQDLEGTPGFVSRWPLPAV